MEVIFVILCLHEFFHLVKNYNHILIVSDQYTELIFLSSSSFVYHKSKDNTVTFPKVPVPFSFLTYSPWSFFHLLINEVVSKRGQEFVGPLALGWVRFPVDVRIIEISHYPIACLFEGLVIWCRKSSTMSLAWQGGLLKTVIVSLLFSLFFYSYTGTFKFPCSNSWISAQIYSFFIYTVVTFSFNFSNF